MKIRFLTLLTAAAAFFFSCTENRLVPDNIEPDLSGSPELPADPQPESTSFSHRIMLLQHTGTYCPNCPNLMTSLKEVAQDNEYSGKYVHVASHSYNAEGDEAYSDAAAKISQAFCSGYYPELTFNLTTENTGTSIAAATIKSHIDALHKDHADVGISAATVVKDGNMYVHTEIKAAAENIYRIAVWVLENGIESEQMGATAEWQHTHNNALRAMAGESLNLRIYGVKLDRMVQGDKKSHSFVIKLEDEWNPEKCKALIIVNAADKEGKYDVANCIVCPAGESVTYDYN